MRLLDRYLLRELLQPLAYCLSGFLVFWITADLIGEVDQFERNQLQVWDVAEYYWAQLPGLLVLLLPIVLLLTQLYALTNLARHHELIAMRSAGLTLWRIGRPYLLVSLVCSGVVLYLNEVWVPDATERAHFILNRRLPDGPATAGGSGWPQLNFVNDHENRKWTIGGYQADTASMRSPMVDWTKPDGTVVILQAEGAAWNGRHWQFTNALLRERIPGEDLLRLTEQTNLLEMPAFTETPARIKSEVKFSGLDSRNAAKRAQLSLAEIQNYLRLHRQLTAADYAKLHTQFHGRLAEPWTCLVVALIALALGSQPARRNVFVAVAGSIFLCFAYFIVQKFGLALGTGGYVTPWLAAWFPNLFFGGLGVWLNSRVA